MQLIVFDADGTLTTTASGAKFPQSPEDKKLRFNPESLPSDAYLVIASNQKGISLGLKSREFAEAEFTYLDDLTKQVFDAIIICPDDGATVWIKPEHDRPFIPFATKGTPHHADFEENPRLSGCESLIGTFRKPQPGMLHLAEALAEGRLWGEPQRQITERIFIGDQDSDRQAAEAAGFKYWDIEDWLKANRENFGNA